MASEVGLAKSVVADLVRIGLVTHEQAAEGIVADSADPALSLFLPLLASFEIELVPMHRAGCPVFFCTGILKSDRQTSDAGQSRLRIIPAGGQGRTPESAALGCLGELTERVSLFGSGVDDSRQFQSHETQPQVDISGILGFSAAQERSLVEKFNLKTGQPRDGTVEWARLSEKRVCVSHLGTAVSGQVPAYCVLFNDDGLNVKALPGLASSIGCAVWRSREGARERALLELAERDAVAQAWYNRLGITRIDPDLLREMLPENLIAYMLSQQREWGVYSVDTDLDVQVVLAVSYGKDGFWPAFGSAAGWTVASACESALQELLQSENSLELMNKAYPVESAIGLNASKVPRQLAYARNNSILDDLPLKEVPGAKTRQLRKTYSYTGLLQSCLDRNFDIWEFDATRADLKIPCIKLLSPDLCTWEPRFGRRRLYEGVVERGLRSSPATEAEFSARPFPF